MAYHLLGNIEETKVVKLATIPDSVNRSFAIRSGEWKYITISGSGGRTRGKVKTKGQLYNMNEDPYEKTNLYDKNPEIVEKLSAMLAEIKKTEVE